MPQVVLWGATYSDVPAVILPSINNTSVTFYYAVDGNNLEYGLTDGALPIVGVGLVGSAELEE